MLFHMSATKSPEPKTVSAAPAPAMAPVAPAPQLPDYVTAIPEGAPVFVLKPTDEIERRHVDEQLEDALFKYFEKVPTHNHELKVARLPARSVLLVAHCVQSRARRADGTFGVVHTLHIGGPIDIDGDKYRAQSQDGYTFSTDLGAVVDAVTKVCKQTNGSVWMAQTSGDPVIENRVVKLLKA